MEAKNIDGWDLFDKCKREAKRYTEHLYESDNDGRNYEHHLIEIIVATFDEQANEYNSLLEKYNTIMEDFVAVNTKYTQLLENYYATFKEQQ